MNEAIKTYAIQPAQRLIVRADADEHARDEERLGDAGFKVRRRLEALARML